MTPRLRYPRAVAVIALLLVGIAPTAQTTLPRVQPGQVIWDGAFKLPHGNFGGTNLSFGYGAAAMGYDPITGGIYISSHDYTQQVALLTIPTPSTSALLGSLPSAAFIQPFSDIYEGRMGQVGGSTGAGHRPGGFLHFNGRLIATAYNWFDADGIAVASHFTHSPTTTATGTVTGPHVFAGLTPKGSGFVAGYMAAIPTVWQALLGGPALSGQCCIPIASRTSYGPNAYVFNPDQLAVVDPVPNTVLLNYPQGHVQPDGDWASDYTTFFNLSTQMGGMLIPTGTRTLLYVGRQGIGKKCYRCSDIDPFAPGDANHAPPYRIQVWAYDLNDLAAVKAGTSQPWDLRPYAIWPLTQNLLPLLPHWKPTMHVRGFAADPASGRFWIVAPFADGDGPVIHQFHIDLTATTVPLDCTVVTTPAGPITLAAAGGSTTLTLTPNHASCQWQIGAPPWLVPSVTSGTGTGSVTLTAAANMTGVTRSEATFAGVQQVTIVQTAVGGTVCTFTVTPTSVSLAGGGGSASVAITPSATTCVWTAATTQGWATVSPTSGTGSGTVTLTAAANTTGVSRTDTATIAGTAVTITQSTATVPPPPPPAGTWVTYLGGSGNEFGRGAAVDASGNVYIAGATASANFPTTVGAYDRTYATPCEAGYCGSGGAVDVFVAKFSPTGTLLWATLLGGPNYDRAYGIAVHPTDGTVYVAGRAGRGFPTTSGVLQPTFLPPSGSGETAYGPQMGFVARLAANGGSLVWSTYVGAASGWAIVRDITVDAAGQAYLHLLVPTGTLPFITSTALQPAVSASGDAGHVILAASGASVVYASYLGGSDRELAGTLRPAGTGFAVNVLSTLSPNLPVTSGLRAYTALEDFYVVKFNYQTGTRTWATYVGGSGREESDTHMGAVDPNGEVVIGGGTTSTNLPGTTGAGQPTNAGGYDQWLTRLSTTGTIVRTTYTGTSANDESEGVFVLADGTILQSGLTHGTTFPVTTGAQQVVSRGGMEATLTLWSPDLTTRRYATYLGGSGNDLFRVAAGVGNRIVGFGETSSSNLLTTTGAAQPTFGGGTADSVVLAVPLGAGSVPRPPTNVRVF
jgi:hypothetical protein